MDLWIILFYFEVKKLHSLTGVKHRVYTDSKIGPFVVDKYV